MEKQEWTIQCGRRDGDSVFIHVIANEQEVEIIGEAIARYESQSRRLPVACIATKGNYSSFHNKCDVLIRDCM